jgi:RNA polymerase sigma-70 factor (ECF subfamily)
MDLSAKGKNLSAYHVEAAIASVHASAPSSRETPWETVVTLYDALMQIRPSPVVALNRALAVAQRDGPRRGLVEIEHIADGDRLAEYPFYFAALGELRLRLGDFGIARAHFADAMRLARNATERRLLHRRIAECDDHRLTLVNGATGLRA